MKGCDNNFQSYESCILEEARGWSSSRVGRLSGRYHWNYTWLSRAVCCIVPDLSCPYGRANARKLFIIWRHFPHSHAINYRLCCIQFICICVFEYPIWGSGVLAMYHPRLLSDNRTFLMQLCTYSQGGRSSVIPTFVSLKDWQFLSSEQRKYDKNHCDIGLSLITFLWTERTAVSEVNRYIIRIREADEK